MLSGDVLEDYLKAGRIASEVRREAKSLVKRGAPLISICESVENGIKKRGGELAFPCNVCVNDVAAHYSSLPGDKGVVPEGAVVKVDLGVQVEGYIADTATTVSLNPQYDGMVFAVNEALEEAVKVVKPRVKMSEVGRTIQGTIERYGFKPIRNLSGHQMTRYVLHAGKSVPNVTTVGFQSMNEGDVYAIEPFLTLQSGAGQIRTGEEAYIFRFQKERKVDNPDTMALQTLIKTSFKSLPFSPRWIEGIEDEKVGKAFRDLVAKKCVSPYPVLIEEKGGLVTQAEHTVVVTRDGCTVTTR